MKCKKKDYIYCLFSIENQYDQPDNNLVAWFNTLPTEAELCKVLGASPKYRATRKYIQDLLAFKSVRLHGCSDHRLQKVYQQEVLGDSTS